MSDFSEDPDLIRPSWETTPDDTDVDVRRRRQSPVRQGATHGVFCDA